MKKFPQDFRPSDAVSAGSPRELGGAVLDAMKLPTDQMVEYSCDVFEDEDGRQKSLLSMTRTP
jgi:hypothetical protein